MESQFSTQPALLLQPLANETSVMKDISLIKCVNNSQAHCICINNICMYENAIMCADINCTCRKMHDSCIIAQMKSILKSIETHARPLKYFEEKVNRFFDATIDKLSIIRDDLIQKHRQLFQRKSYSPSQLSFISLLQSNSLKQINGALVSQITSKINDREAINKMMKNSQEQLQKISTKMENFVHSLSSQMEKILMQLERQFMSESHYKNVHLDQPYLFGSSQVVTTHQQENILQQFFTDNIFQATLLYRASQHQFKGDIFHKLCEDIPNILVLVKTSYEKLIGGYTPLGFSSTQRDAYMNDPQMKSFLFSITEGDKLQMKSQQNATMNEKDSDYVLRFGGGSDLRISNRADQNVLSYSAISTTYKNQKYGSNTDSYKKFTGSDTIYFKVSEWQVWKLTLG